MSTTTEKLGKNQVRRPSGIVASKDGKYFYWKCTVSGVSTFASAERFVSILERFGSEENLFKTFVCRPAQKYIDGGVSADEIRKLTVGGKLPPYEGKSKVTELPTKAVKASKATKNAVIVAEVEVTTPAPAAPVVIEPPKVVVYAWSGNPDYFKSVETKATIADLTREACQYPNRLLDNQCHGCSFYNECICPSKMGPADWAKPRGPGVKAKKINSFDV